MNPWSLCNHSFCVYQGRVQHEYLIVLSVWNLFIYISTNKFTVTPVPRSLQSHNTFKHQPLDGVDLKDSFTTNSYSGPDYLN